MVPSLLTCPVCHKPLTLDGAAFRCRSGHSFDRAREGYVNLAPSRKPSVASYSREMLTARDAFLSAGHYRPLVDALVAAIRAEARPRVILDAGCGTGFYLEHVARSVNDNRDGPICAGVDVSKDAVKLACRRLPNGLFAVCDILHRIELASESVDVILSIFSPRNVTEFARLLRPQGVLALAMAGTDHFVELRKELNLLDVEADKEERTVRVLEERFTITARDRVSFALELAAKELIELLTMSPNFFHREKQGWTTQTFPEGRRLTVDTRLLVARPKR